MTTLRFSEVLRAAAGPGWDRAARHPFVDRLGDGALDLAAWRRYLIDDYAFVDSLAAVLGHAIAAAPGMRPKAKLAGFLAALTSAENDFFLRSFDALGVAEADWRNARMGGVMQGFADHMAEAVATAGYPGALAALLPAEWIYLDWGTWIADARPRPEAFYFAEWIDLHALPDFVAFVGWLQRETDRIGAAADAATRADMQRIFLRMVELEGDFFDWTLKG